MPAGRHQEELSWLLSQVAHRFDQRLGAALAPAGLTLAQWRMLRLLSDGTSHAMREVADYAMLPPPTLTKAVDRLAAAELLYRRADPADRRRVLVQLTARGRRLQLRLAGDLGQAMAIVGKVLTDEEVVRLRELLQGILQRSR
jgi:MarR family transcriptional regulator, organic hydroperoxide resistance regulator